MGSHETSPPSGLELVRGKRHNFSFLQLQQGAMEQHLDNLFFSTNDDDRHALGYDDELCDDPNDVQALAFGFNQLSALPRQLAYFQNLLSLDVSSNQLVQLDPALCSLRQLRVLNAKNNLLEADALPKDFGCITSLTELNLSGNNLRVIPPQIWDLENLRFLSLGGNQIAELPASVRNLQWLEILYLGGNMLTEIPAEVGYLLNLEALILCENRLESLPSSITNLKKLRSLSLHKNRLTTLPPEIVTLRGLHELSLRDNPLVVRFVRDMTFDPPSLLELAARVIKTKNIPISHDDLPSNLFGYLMCAQRCVNPKCKGVYFDVCVEHIKFVDFCGKYRIPLLQYLCSPKCSITPAVYTSDSDSSPEDDLEVPASKMKKVLLG